MKITKFGIAIAVLLMLAMAARLAGNGTTAVAGEQQVSVVTVP